MKKFLVIPAFLLSVVIAGGQLNSQTPRTEKEDAGTDSTFQLAPMPEHQKSDLLMMTLLSRYHYKKPAINDSLSSAIYNNYLAALDYNRSYFLQSDIDEFEKYRDELDDDLKLGRLKPAYDIFNRFIQRLDERQQFIHKALEKEFDYSADEYYEIDRKNAPWAKSSAELDEIWRKRLKNEALNDKLDKKEWKSTSERLNKRYDVFTKRMKQYKSEDVFQLFMNEFTSAIDPHTNYLSPVSSENFKIEMSLSLEGIGATLGTEDDYTRIVELVPGGPAYKSKELKANDKIVAVGQGEDGEMVDVIGWRIDDVVKLIRGPKGTLVRLNVIPADAGVNAPAKEVRIIREKVKLEEQAAKKEVIEGTNGSAHYKIGVITVPKFYSDYDAQARGEKDYKSTTKDVRRLIKELQEEKVDGIIMDLRNNGGGSLQEAIELTGLFIKDGPVVQVRNSDGTVEVGTDPDPAMVYTGPMAVMVNRFSASASEIFTGAIQNYRRGIVVGEQTYGKGTVQNMIDLNRFQSSDGTKLGQLKLTIAKYYRIDGGSTQNKGVYPDIYFPATIDTAEYGESSEPSALPYDRINSTDFATYGNIRDMLPKLTEKFRERTSKNPVFAVMEDEFRDYKEAKSKKTVSLKEDVRRKERDDAEEKRLARQNKRREVQGLKLLDKGETAPKDEKIDDPLIKESANILSDYILLTSK
ncbi:MAG: carboxy terminal-processing peptidase [Bacteroidota bacterium]